MGCLYLLFARWHQRALPRVMHASSGPYESASPLTGLRSFQPFCSVHPCDQQNYRDIFGNKAKFHYTGPTGPDRTRADPHGPARTLTETRTDPKEFLGDPGRKKVRAGAVGSGRALVVEFSLSPTKCADFVRSGPVRSGPCSGS